MQIVKWLVYCGLAVLMAVTITGATLGLAHACGHGAVTGALFLLVAFWAILKWSPRT